MVKGPGHVRVGQPSSPRERAVYAIGRTVEAAQNWQRLENVENRKRIEPQVTLIRQSGERSLETRMSSRGRIQSGGRAIGIDSAAVGWTRRPFTHTELPTKSVCIADQRGSCQSRE